MPRKFPKPFFRSARNCWFVQIGGKQVRLHPDEAEAMRLYHELMAKRNRPATNSTLTAPAAIRVASDDTLSTFELFEKYLAWCEKHRAGRTFEWYRDHIQSFVEHLGRTVLEPYTAIKPFMVVEWADSHEAWGDSYRRGAISPSWKTDTAVSLARQMYDARDFSAMPILADALQDAGCDSEAILNHCRDRNQVHVRGCWVVDSVLGQV